MKRLTVAKFTAGTPPLVGIFPASFHEPITPPETKGESAAVDANERPNKPARIPLPYPPDEPQLDEFGRIVYDDEAPTAPPIPEEDQAPFWDGWNTDKMGLNGEEVRLFSVIFLHT